MDYCVVEQNFCDSPQFRIGVYANLIYNNSHFEGLSANLYSNKILALSILILLLIYKQKVKFQFIIRASLT